MAFRLETISAASQVPRLELRPSQHKIARPAAGLMSLFLDAPPRLNTTSPFPRIWKLTSPASFGRLESVPAIERSIARLSTPCPANAARVNYRHGKAKGPCRGPKTNSSLSGDARRKHGTGLLQEFGRFRNLSTPVIACTLSNQILRKHVQDRRCESDDAFRRASDNAATDDSEVDPTSL